MSNMEAELRRRFTRRRVSDEQAQKQDLINQKALELSLLIAEATPVNRQQSVALTNIEQAAMWANKAISHDQEEG